MYSDTPDGPELRVAVAELLREWKVDPAQFGALSQYGMIALLLGHPNTYGVPYLDYFTPEHADILRAIVTHGYPIYKMLLIRRGLI